MNNPACSLLGCSVPIVLAGMGGVSRSELVAAVSAAGGFGFLGMVREPTDLIVEEVGQVRRMGHARFGVNLIPAATAPELLDQQIEACIQLAVPVVATFWDLDERVTQRLRDAGILVVHQIGSVDEAIAAERSGVGIIIAQGREAGGHVRGVRPLRELLPEVVDAVRVPILAAGGLATGEDLVTAMALGAAGIVVGTALMATRESFAHPYHKQRLIAAEAGDTVLTSSFHINWPRGAPVRVLKSVVTSGGRGDPHKPDGTIIGAEGERPIYLFSTDSPLRSMTGDLESMALYAGTGVGRIDDVSRAGDRIATIAAGLDGLLDRTSGSTPEPSSPVCYASEMSGAYMGTLSVEELSSELRMLADDLRIALQAKLAQATDPHVASQPPFPGRVWDLAIWAFRLQRLAATSGSNLHCPANPPLRLAQRDGSLAEASILGRLRRILPNVADDSIRAVLILLQSFVESRLVPRRLPVDLKTYLSETPVASGR